MTNKELEQIREYIACPQFGDNKYGEWGILNLEQRKTIRRLLNHIKILEDRVKYLEIKYCGRTNIK